MWSDHISLTDALTWRGDFHADLMKMVDSLVPALFLRVMVYLEASDLWQSLISKVVLTAEDSTHTLPVSVRSSSSPFFQDTLGVGLPMMGIFRRTVLPSLAM